VKSLMLLLREVLNELGTWCGTSTVRDLKTITKRVEDEGLSFLTITLPAFCQDFQKSLDEGSVGRQSFLGFKRKGELPLLLGGFLDLVFDRGTGVLLKDPNIDAIFAIREITLLFAKISLPCSKKRERKAMQGFVECERIIKNTDRSLEPSLRDDFMRISLLLWADVFQKVEEDIYYDRVIPKHGPGSTADKLLGNQKFNQIVWTERLEQIFRTSDYLLPNPRYHQDLDHVEILEPGREIPVKVISVPKTLKTPRIIAVEPTCMQYAQQAISESLVEAIEQDDICSKLVGFSDQEPNRQLAREGSLERNLATLDLSEASDRVSNQLVRDMLKFFPHFAEGVDASRSRKADIPGHGVKRLAKFASMGSALCFPIEAIVFTTIIFMALEKEQGHQLTRSAIRSWTNQVQVYGDDIIVPVGIVHRVVEMLSAFGLKVNLNKSFWTGRFRESCGQEFYDGNDVSVVKCRHILPSRLEHVTEIISAVSLRNQFYMVGMWKTCAYMDRFLGALIKMPKVYSTSPVLGKVSLLGYDVERLHPDLHSPLVKGYRVVSRPPPDHLEGSGALLKVFLKRGEQPFADRKHLERAGRPKSVSIKLRWSSPY
jgi:hypothetical protein